MDQITEIRLLTHNGVREMRVRDHCAIFYFPPFLKFPTKRTSFTTTEYLEDGVYTRSDPRLRDYLNNRRPLPYPKKLKNSKVAFCPLMKAECYIIDHKIVIGEGDLIVFGDPFRKYSTRNVYIFDGLCIINLVKRGGLLAIPDQFSIWSS